MIIADTRAPLVDPQPTRELSAHARAAMDERAVGVAVITFWEIAMLVSRHRVTLDDPVVDWLHDVMALPQMAMLPLTIEVAATAATSPTPFVIRPIA